MTEAPPLQFSAAEMAVLRERYDKLTQFEFEAFLAAASRYQLNPLANQIYARLQPETQKNPRSITYCAQIDGYRLIADRTGLYAGNDDPVCEYDAKGGLVKATVTVHKLVNETPRPFTSSARWPEYCPGGNQDWMWRKMPHLMLGKCSEALALRKAFPAELAGLYTLEEMQQADDDAPHAPPSAVEKKPPTVTELIHSCDTAAKLAKFLQEMVGTHPITKFPAEWPKILAVAEEHMKGQTWTEPQKASVLAVIFGVRASLPPEETPAPPAEAPKQRLPETETPAPQSLEALAKWIGEQRTPQDMVNMLTALETHPRCLGTRLDAKRFKETVEEAQGRMEYRLHQGEWAEADCELLLEKLSHMNQLVAAAAQSTEAFHGR